MIEFLHALPLLVKAALLGVVEGLTEFLPISSTGHLILAGSLLGFSDDKAKLFDVAIQTGAMLAVVWFYRERIGATLAGLGHEPRARRFAINILIAFLPAAVLGVTFGRVIKTHLFKPVPVALAFIDSIDDIAPLDALKLGLAQAVALVPGTSRSGATIMGGMLFGLSRRAATEFSFFLAIPTLVGAGVYDTWKYRALVSPADVPLFAVGLVTAFLSALVCVRWLIRFVATHDFMAFAWYRIVFGALVLLTAHFGWVNWAA